MMNYKHFAFVCFIILSLLLSGCTATNPPIGHIIASEDNEYGEYNVYVRDCLNEQQTSFLPPQKNDLDIVEYRYEYECAVLGDPNFSIRLKVKYDSESFQKECNRLSHEALITDPVTECFVVYSRGDILSDVDELFNERTLDGASFFFELAFSDCDELTVDYLISKQWDGSKRLSDTASYLQRVIGFYDNNTV